MYRAASVILTASTSSRCSSSGGGTTAPVSTRVNSRAWSSAHIKVADWTKLIRQSPV